MLHPFSLPNTRRNCRKQGSPLISVGNRWVPGPLFLKTTIKTQRSASKAILSTGNRFPELRIAFEADRCVFIVVFKNKGPGTHRFPTDIRGLPCFQQLRRVFGRENGCSMCC